MDTTLARLLPRLLLKWGREHIRLGLSAGPSWLWLRFSLVEPKGCSQHPVLGDQRAPTHMLSILPQAELPWPWAQLGILPQYNVA